MANGIKWEMVTDNTQEVIREKNVRVTVALEAMGLEAEKFAKGYISGDANHPRRVDTGNLRNSIAHEVAKSEEAVYVGTNVEYAEAVHEGAHGMTPNRYLRDAAKDHVDRYKEIVKTVLEG